jgi:hypothetical protein
MSRARTARRKARKLDPIGYEVRRAEIRTRKMRLVLEIMGVPPKKAVKIALEALRTRDLAQGPKARTS